MDSAWQATSLATWSGGVLFQVEPDRQEGMSEPIISLAVNPHFESVDVMALHQVPGDGIN
jgi:hypothetical protein